MNEIKYIFEATNRKDVLKRFLIYNKEKVYNIKKHQSTSYYVAIDALERTFHVTCEFSVNDVKEACKNFAVAEQCNKMYDSLHAKFGQLICHYLLGNTLDVESITQNILNTIIPEKRNLKGVFVNIGKGLIVGAGVVVSFFPPAKMIGVAMTHYARGIRTEELTAPDSEINQFIINMREVDFKNLLNNRPNLK